MFVSLDCFNLKLDFFYASRDHRLLFDMNFNLTPLRALDINDPYLQRDEQ